MIYKIGTLAKKTGFSPNLIRIWEQRYGFLTPMRGAGKQRLFSEEDCHILLYLRKELGAGRSIGELAMQGRENLLRNAKVYQASQQNITSPKELSSDSGFRPIIKESIDGIVDAAVRVDFRLLDQTLQCAFSFLHPSRVINEIITPAMIEIGKGWKEGRISIAGEHMASIVFEQKIVSLLDASQVYSQATSGSRSALCACFPAEDHKMGILSIAYHLASHGFPVIFLGNALPFKDLEYAINNIRPASVWLSVTRSSLYRRHLKELVDLVKRYQPLQFFIGGQALTKENKALKDVGCHQCLKPFILPDDLAALPFFAELNR